MLIRNWKEDEGGGAGALGSKFIIHYMETVSKGARNQRNPKNIRKFKEIQGN